MKTFSLATADVKKKWYVIDAKDLILGRLASVISMRLRGKHKPDYTPHVDCGDHVIVVNAEQIKVTGNKLKDKKFYWHTGFAGGIKERTVGQILSGSHPERVITKAVERMVTRGPLGRKQMTHLKVYAGPQHPHIGQQPETLDVGSMNRKNVSKNAQQSTR